MADALGLGAAVLIVDDDGLVRMVLRMAIENLGHSVIDVASSDDLVTALKARSFGLCFMDASIPGSSIEQRLDLLDALAPATPVVIMSGYSARPDSVAERGLQFMTKPIGLDELTKALADIGGTLGSGESVTCVRN